NQVSPGVPFRRGRGRNGNRPWLSCCKKCQSGLLTGIFVSGAAFHGLLGRRPRRELDRVVTNSVARNSSEAGNSSKVPRLFCVRLAPQMNRIVSDALASSAVVLQ